MLNFSFFLIYFFLSLLYTTLMGETDLETKNFSFFLIYFFLSLLHNANGRNGSKHK